MVYWICALLSLRSFFSSHKSALRYCAAATLLLLICITQFSSEQTADSVSPLAARPAPTFTNLARNILPGSTTVSANSFDLAAIRESGHLRVLTAKTQHQRGERDEATAGTLLAAYAADQGLQLEVLEVAQPERIPELLQAGKGDIMFAADGGIVDAALDKLELTLPWGVSQQQVISRSDTAHIRNMRDLRTRQIAIKASSPMWQELQELAKLNPSMSLLRIDESEKVESILQRVVSGQYDVTIVDNLLVENLLPRYLNLEVAFNASEGKMLSWAVSKRAPELAASLNSFINKQYLQAQIAQSYRADLPELQSKKLLRLITYQSPVNYYLHQGKLRGFEHDLIKRFASSHKMRLDVVIADSHEDMQRLLLAGRGDLVAASVPRSSLSNEKKLALTQSYSHAAPVVIGRTKDSPLLDVQALSGRRIVLPASSPYYRLMHNIQSAGVDFDLVVADTDESTESILFRVAKGMYDLTVISSNEIKAQFARQINIRTHFAITEPLPQVWAVRQSDTQLLSALNEFIGKEFRKGFYNVLYTKYIEEPRVTVGDTELVASSEPLSPYDEIVYKYAEHYDFDWRLIVAQMYQESQFDPNAQSYAGAEGLMQLIPETASLLGIADVYDPDSSIQAGVRYMDYLRSKFDDQQLLEDRIWFSLAAYNAGYNRVRRARELAERMNLDKNKWFDNVEKAMMALSNPRYIDGESVSNCRCGQTVVYVRDIRTLYNNYVRLTRGQKVAVQNEVLNRGI